jgi:phosphoribosylamine-glycine ligase
MNIMSLFQGDWPDVMERITAGRLGEADVPLREEASLVLYLVSPDYALRAGPPCEFTVDCERIEADGCHAFFSSATRVGEDTYRTVGTSRALALATTAPTLEQARLRIVEAAASVPVLEWRRDVGDERYLTGLSRLVQPALSGREAPMLGDVA